MKKKSGKVNKLLQFFNNGKPYETTDDLIVKKTDYGVDFELMPYNWLIDKLYFDRQTRYLQNRLDDYLDRENLPSWQIGDAQLNKGLTSKRVKRTVNHYFSTGDDFEIGSREYFNIYILDESSSRFSNYRDAEFVLIEYDHKYLIAKPCSDSFELHLHGAEYYCYNCEGDSKCACSGDFCELSEVQSSFDFSSREEMIEAVRNYIPNKERLMSHPRLFDYDDKTFETLFTGKPVIHTEDFLIDGDDIFCPNCFNKTPIEESFSLYR